MEQKTKKTIEVVAGVSGSVAGGTIGTLLAGPLGGAIGSLVGFGIQFGILSLSEHVGKELSTRELKKIGTVLDYSVKRIHERINAGDKPRNDGFFDDSPEGAADKEIFEGVVLAAQREHELKKLKYLGNLYANIAFTPDISRAEANQLIKAAEQLTYRQLCIIKAIAYLQLAKGSGVDLAFKQSFRTLNGYNYVALATELYWLYSQGIISSSSAVFDPAGLCPANLSITGVSAQLYNLMGLNDFVDPMDIELPITLLTTGGQSDVNSNAT